MIQYRYFWPGFTGEGSLLEYLISTSIPNSENLDVSVSSVFTFSSFGKQIIERTKAQVGISSYEDYRELALYRHPRIDLKADINIWYTGENLRPPSNGYDLSLSFDRTDLDRKVPNVYFPYWMYNINWGQSMRKDIREFYPTPTELVNPVVREKDRTDFCCAFFNNSEPMRLSMLQTLEKIAKVDTYGQLFRRPVQRKSEVATKYVFMLTPENSYFPGYITEKVFEARSVGCIPIWWGCNESGVLNKHAFVNATGLNSTDLISTVKRIYASKQLQEEMLAQPLLLETPELESTLEAISHVFKKIV